MAHTPLTQEQADRIAKWRWGKYAEAYLCTSHPFNAAVSTGDRPDDAIYYGPPSDFAAAFRASMQSPMSDKDAELEAKLRWGDEGDAWKIGARCFVGCRHNITGWAEGYGDTWKRAFECADRRADKRARPAVVGRAEEAFTYPVVGTYHPNPVAMWAAVDPNDKPRRPGANEYVLVKRDGAHGTCTFSGTAATSCQDLTQPEALTEAKALWGERAYAMPAVGTVACAVGCPGIARGEGATFRAALADAACRALAMAFGRVGCAAVRERNKAIGQAMMQPPEWAYPAAWRMAVMAAVEWASAQHVPVSLADWTDGPLEVLTTTLRAYHADRLTHCEQDARKRRGSGCFAAAICAAYERGRLGGGR